MRAYERLLNYVRVYTTSDPESGTHPSAEREFDLARQLVEEMKALGIEDARVDEHCYVYGSIPATPGCEDKPALGLIAHMDTAPDASGEGVSPILHENYDGRDVTLPATGMVMKVSTFPFLADHGDRADTAGAGLCGAGHQRHRRRAEPYRDALAAAAAVPHPHLCVREQDGPARPGQGSAPDPAEPSAGGWLCGFWGRAGRPGRGAGSLR